jgi:alcohol dehydrogenase
MKVIAAVLRTIGAPAPYAESRPLSVEEVELEPPGPGEVLVRIRAAGLCHSDLSVINGERPRAVPLVLGHESAGEVAECGQGVTDLKPGDTVVLVFVPSCGCCRPCAEGRPALCEPAVGANIAGTLLSGSKPFHSEGQRLNHHTGVSCFSEYTVVSRRSCVKLEAKIPFAQAALFGCAVLTGVGAVINTARVQAGSTVAVVGLGGVGLNALLAATASGAREIVAVDLSEEKLTLARELGATLTFNAAVATTAEAIRGATDGGVDVALEMAGSINALELAYQITRRGGTTVTAGAPNADRRFSFAPITMVGEERILRGSYIGSSVPVRDIPRYVDLYRKGKLPIDRLMGRRLPLAEINAGFDHLATGQSLRDVIVF